MMTDDCKLLEMAAKAAGIDLVWHYPDDGEREHWCFIPSAKPPHNRRERDKNAGVIWNPLDDDGDALRLAVKLDLEIRQVHLAAHAGQANHFWSTERYGDDPCAATRRAIVRAAASMVIA